MAAMAAFIRNRCCNMSCFFVVLIRKLHFCLWPLNASVLKYICNEIKYAKRELGEERWETRHERQGTEIRRRDTLLRMMSPISPFSPPISYLVVPCIQLCVLLCSAYAHRLYEYYICVHMQ